MDDTAFVQRHIDTGVPLPPGTYWINAGGVNVRGGSFIEGCVFKPTDDVPRIGLHYIKDRVVLMGKA